MPANQRIIVTVPTEDAQRVYTATAASAGVTERQAVDEDLARARPLILCRGIRKCDCLKPFLSIDVLPGEQVTDFIAKYNKPERGWFAYEAPQEVHPPSHFPLCSCWPPTMIPPPPAKCFPARVDPYRAQQHYLDAAPLGIDIGAAAGLDFKPVTLVDIEQGWQRRHEDIVDSDVRPVEGVNHRFHGHGTAVLGILAAQRNNGLGIRGILPDALTIKPISQYWAVAKGEEPIYSTVEAICVALNWDGLKAGDIIMLQAQHRDPVTGYLVPVEADPAVYCAITCAVKRGVIVIEAAGNGGLYIDNLELNGRKRFRPDCPSGAILVAAATAEHDHRPMFFSNRGTYIQCYAWGEDVTTCGDGETSQELDDYIPEFGGTSSATAIVAGVAAFAQAIARAKGKNLSPDEMLWLLTKGGTPPAPGSPPIGVMPNLAAIVKNIRNGIYWKPPVPPPPCDGDKPDKPISGQPPEQPTAPPSRSA